MEIFINLDWGLAIHTDHLDWVMRNKNFDSFKGKFWHFGKKIFDTLEKENFDSLERKILTVWKGKFWQFGKGNFDSLEKENFDSLKRKFWQFVKGKFWQFGKGNFDSLKKNFDTQFGNLEDGKLKNGNPTCHH
jgi:hypothetical protein